MWVRTPIDARLSFARIATSLPDDDDGFDNFGTTHAPQEEVKQISTEKIDNYFVSCSGSQQVLGAELRSPSLGFSRTCTTTWGCT
jgi:hypothetical protein